MKNAKVFLLVLSLFGFSPLYSQLKVIETGNVLMHTSAAVEDNVDKQAKLSVKKTSGSSYSGYSHGIHVKSDPMAGVWNYGMALSVGNGDVLTSGRAFGIFASVANHTSGYNYGVVGNVSGTANGAGIYGTLNGIANSVPGRYAGYFNGNVMVTGTLNGTVIGSSDIRLKENISELNSEEALNNIVKMNPIQYNYKQIYVEAESDTGLVKAKVFDESSLMFQKKQYGLSAQELKEIYPELVYEQDNGYLAINYTGLIPIPIQSVKELKEEIDGLKQENRSLMQNTNSVTDIESVSESQIAVLYQNTPNPFSTTTQIKYYLPTDVNKASLLIYDMQGKQLKQYNIPQSGEGNIEISGDELPAGMYLYALIADGIEVDVKRMILTE